MVEEEIKQQPTEEPKAANMVIDAHNAAEKLKVENERMEANILKLQELQAIKTLGGESDSGRQPPKPKEETPAEYTKRIQEDFRSGSIK